MVELVIIFLMLDLKVLFVVMCLVVDDCETIEVLWWYGKFVWLGEVL